MSNVCPKGHFSTDSDYCSECGTRMDAAPAQQAAPPAGLSGTSAADRCPDCGTNRPTAARYCEVCRFDFQTQMPFSGLAAVPASRPATVPPAGAAPASIAAAVASPAATPSAKVPVQRLLLRVVVDPSLYQEPDPEAPCPQNAPEKVFHLDLEENTLGRQYEGKGLHPEIVVVDPSISRRHLKFIRNDAGGFSVLELGSVNGTQFNGTALEAGVVTAIKPGDQLTLGMWTRLHVEER